MFHGELQFDDRKVEGRCHADRPRGSILSTANAASPSIHVAVEWSELPFAVVELMGWEIQIKAPDSDIAMGLERADKCCPVLQTGPMQREQCKQS